MRYVFNFKFSGHDINYWNKLPWLSRRTDVEGLFRRYRSRCLSIKVCSKGILTTKFLVCPILMEFNLQRRIVTISIGLKSYSKVTCAASAFSIRVAPDNICPRITFEVKINVFGGTMILQLQCLQVRYLEDHFTTIKCFSLEQD